MVSIANLSQFFVALTFSHAYLFDVHIVLHSTVRVLHCEITYRIIYCASIAFEKSHSQNRIVKIYLCLFAIAFRYWSLCYTFVWKFPIKIRTKLKNIHNLSRNKFECFWNIGNFFYSIICIESWCLTFSSEIPVLFCFFKCGTAVEIKQRNYLKRTWNVRAETAEYFLYW